MHLDKEYWDNSYQTNATPWDIGQISLPLKSFIDEIKNKEITILIPGAGRAHEAVYLHKSGFKNVYVCDWAEHAFEGFKGNCGNFPANHLLIKDFFTLEGKYDFILEQTFFCALDPTQRPDYVEKMATLLNKGGIVAGLLFASHFSRPGPPFGGTKPEYLTLFEPLFEIIEMEIAQNSILPRLGNELFFQMKKR